MNKILAEIKSNKKIAEGTWEMKLMIPECEAEIRAGQFVNIRIDGFYLRRPISVCMTEGDILSIVYKTVGQGTEAMSEMKAGSSIDLLYPLGNGFDTEENCGDSPVIAGGGAGVAPCLELARRLVQKGIKPTVILGFRNTGEIFCEQQFRQLDLQLIITTEDGSCGVKGFVTDALKETECSYVFACGPEPMLRSIDEMLPADIPGQLSFEERMGCGFGACMGCSCKTKYGNKRICKEGPVLKREEVIWSSEKN